MTPTIVWFRRDLRLDDNPAWSSVDPASPTTALFVIDDALFDRAGPARRAQLVAHLAALDEALAARGGRLRVERGGPATVVARVSDELGAGAVHVNADVTPYSRRRDDAVRAALGSVELRSWWGSMVHEPGRVLTAKGALSLVFTPFFRAWSTTRRSAWPAGPGPDRVEAKAGDGVPALPGAPFQAGGPDAALGRLAEWSARADRYDVTRDLPAVEGTSTLSADLKFGTLSPRRVADTVGSATPGRAAFVRQLAWRDWYAHMLWERPDLVDAAMKPAFDHIAWRDDPAGLEAWQRGRTGFPLVDAGMRQLAATGWMHNRVRMVVASFLVKDLLIDWRQGERWFRHHLVDGDVSQNVGNWQWVAGTGPDAAPYFRIFNPTAQAERFDPDGTYARRWIPELGTDAYPAPIVDHGLARARTLEAFAAAKALDA